MGHRTNREHDAGSETQQPIQPGEAAKQRGDIPTGGRRNEDYGKGRQSGGVADESKHEREQEAELDMNERNR